MASLFKPFDTLVNTLRTPLWGGGHIFEAPGTVGRDVGTRDTRIILEYSLAYRVPTDSKKPRELFGKTLSEKKGSI